MAEFISALLALIVAHKFVAVGALGATTLVTLLSDRIGFLPTWTSPLRPLLGTLAGVAGVVCDQVSNGGSVSTAVIAALSTAGPVLVAELLALMGKGGGGGPGGGKVVQFPVPVKNDSGKPPAGPYSTPMTSLLWGPLDLVGKRGVRAMRQVVAGVLIATMAMGCAAIASITPILQTVIARGQDAIIILNILQSAIGAFFAVSPNPSLQGKVDVAFQTAALALDAAIRATSGTVDLTAEQADAAFEEFRKAYDDLVQLLATIRIVTPTASTALQVRKGDGTYALVPLAFTRLK